MTEFEQIRSELNELRERVAVLENKPAPIPFDLMRLGPRQLPKPGVILNESAKVAIRSAMKQAAEYPGTRVRCAITGQDLGSAD